MNPSQDVSNPIFLFGNMADQHLGPSRPYRLCLYVCTENGKLYGNIMQTVNCKCHEDMHENVCLAIGFEYRGTNKGHTGGEWRLIL